MTIARRIGAAAAALAVAGGAAIATSTTAAAAPPPHLATFGDVINLAPNGACHGDIHVGMDQRGDHVTVTLTPRGTYGTNRCPADVVITTLSGLGETTQQVTMRGQDARTIRIGHGLGMVNATVTNAPAFGVANYVVM